MSNTCAKLLNPVDRDAERTLAKVAGLAAERGLPILLVGAFARDLHFWHMHGIEPGRATADMDITIQMADWSSYDDFGQVLREAGFSNPNRAHREKFRDAETGREVDLLPFGEISPDGQNITWPEDNSSWSVVGIAEALVHAECLRIQMGADTHGIPFVSLPGLVMLKVVAISDRPEDRYKRDGSDIGLVIEHYLAMGNRDRLLARPHDKLLRHAQGDLDLATALLLGRDIAGMASAPTCMRLGEILGREVASQSWCPLTQGLQNRCFHGNFSRARAIVKALAEGVAWHNDQPFEE